MSLPHFMPTTHFSLLTTIHYKLCVRETSLVVQWLRLCIPDAAGQGSVPGQGTRAHMLQLRVHMLQLKIPHTVTKIDP